MKASSRKKRAALRTYRRIRREEYLRGRYLRILDAHSAEMRSRLREWSEKIGAGGDE